MKTRRIKLTLTLPDFGDLLRSVRRQVTSASQFVAQFRLPRRSGNHDDAPPLQLIDPIVSLEVDLPAETAGPGTRPKLQPLPRFNRAGFRGRSLAVVLSPTTLEDYVVAGQFGTLKRTIERYDRSFDRIYVLSPDAIEFTVRLGSTKAVHLGMPRRLPARRFLSTFLLPLLHRRSLANVTVVRALDFAAGITGALIRRKTGARVFVSSGLLARQEKAGRASRFLGQKGLSRADEIIAHDPLELDELSTDYPDTPVHLIDRAVDTGRFCPARTTDPQAAPRLLFVGRLAERSNLPLLFDALELAAKRVPGLRLAVVGDGPLRVQLEQDARERELPVEFTGHIDNESLPSLYSRGFAFVLPSENESVPTSLLEAMSAATPCIATKSPAAQSLLTHTLSGLLVPPGEAQPIADAIVRLHREPALRTRLGIEARRFVISHFSIDASLDRGVDILLGRAEEELRAAA